MQTLVVASFFDTHTTFNRFTDILMYVQRRPGTVSPPPPREEDLNGIVAYKPLRGKITKLKMVYLGRRRDRVVGQLRISL